MIFTPLFRKVVLQTFVSAFLLGLDIVILGSIILNNVKGHGIHWQYMIIFIAKRDKLGMLSYSRKIRNV